MRDSDFKNLSHLVVPNRIASRGSEVSRGYKPDITITDDDSVLRFILESEQKTDRKAFLGDLIKAEVHAEHTQSRPALIIVMEEKSNATVRQLGAHLTPYVAWLRGLKGGTLCLSAVHVISDTDYLTSIANADVLGSPTFWQRGYAVA